MRFEKLFYLLEVSPYTDHDLYLYKQVSCRKTDRASPGAVLLYTRSLELIGYNAA